MCGWRRKAAAARAIIGGGSAARPVVDACTAVVHGDAARWTCAALVPEAVVLREPTKWLVDLERLGTGKALPEYPWLAVQLVNLPLQLGVPTILHYYAAVVAFFLAVDAGVARLLWRVGE